MNTAYPPPRPRRAVWPFLVGVLVLALLFCTGIVSAVAFSEPREGVLPAVTPNPGSRPTADVTAPKLKPRPGRIGEGMWEVGSEVKPGKYRTNGMREDAVLCYWHSAKDTGTDNIIEQGMSSKQSEPGIITLEKGQFFKTSGCQDWVPR